MTQNNNETVTKSVKILLVEDNPGDVELTKRILRNSNFDLDISVAEDGEVAMDILYQKGVHKDRPRPDLILLDLKMPKMDGFEVLQALSIHHVLKHVPVMILTSSAAEGSLVFDLGAHPSRFCRKPLDLERFDNLVGQIVS